MALPLLSDFQTFRGMLLSDKGWDYNCQVVIDFLTQQYDVRFGAIVANTLVADISGCTGFPTDDISIVAGETLSPGDLVRESSSTALKATNASDAGITGVLGFVVSGGSTGSTITVRIRGTYSGLTGLTPNSTYYVGTDGAITTTKPSTRAKPIGWAVSSTLLIVSIPFTELSATFPYLNSGMISVSGPGDTEGVTKFTRVLSATTGINPVSTIEANSSGTTDSTFGVAHDFKVEAANGTVYTKARLEAKNSSAGNTSGEFNLRVQNLDGLISGLKISPSPDYPGKNQTTLFGPLIFDDGLGSPALSIYMSSLTGPGISILPDNNNSCFIWGNTTSPIVSIRNLGSGTGIVPAAELIAQSSSSANSSYGVYLSFKTKSQGGSERQKARIVARNVSAGDTYGRLEFDTFNSGTAQTALTLDENQDARFYGLANFEASVSVNMASQYLYFGTPNTADSFRFALSGSTLELQKWDGAAYTNVDTWS